MWSCLDGAVLATGSALLVAIVRGVLEQMPPYASLALWSSSGAVVPMRSDEGASRRGFNE